MDVLRPFLGWEVLNKTAAYFLWFKSRRHKRTSIDFGDKWCCGEMRKLMPLTYMMMELGAICEFSDEKRRFFGRMKNEIKSHGLQKALWDGGRCTAQAFGKAKSRAEQTEEAQQLSR